MPTKTTKMNYKDFISLVGDRLGVPKVFRDSIFGIESKGGKPDIHDSVKGAMGPGQLMPDTARRLGVNPRDPAQNIYGSLKLQRQLLDKYRKITGGDEDKAWLLAAAAYNAGEPAVDKFKGIPPYKETRNYIRMLAANMRAARGSEARVQPQQQALKPLPAPRTDGRPPKQALPFEVAPKATPPPTAQTTTAQPSVGLTPPPKQGRVGRFIQGTAQMAGMGPLGIFSEDTRRSFFEGVTRATGSGLADFGYLFTNPLTNPLGYAFKKATGLEHPFKTFGERLERGAVAEAGLHKASTTLGRFRQGVATGTGASLIEIPKLVGGSTLAGPLTLPIAGGVTGARTEGFGGLVKGAAMGAVYHYGGQITGQYLGKVGNSLFWIGAPAVEQYLVQGVPLEEALGSSIPMGLFAGAAGSNRARVVLPNGNLRPATPLDIPKILKGTLPLAEPNQVVMYGAVERARSKFTRLLQEEGGFVGEEGGEGRTGKLTRLPKRIMSDLVTVGAFHYEAGTRSLEDWMGRMLPEIGEQPGTISPMVARQLGEVYARSKAVYDSAAAPPFFSGLKQSIKELTIQGLVDKNVSNTSRLFKLLKERGQQEELLASGLLEHLSAVKQRGGLYTLEDVYTYLDTKGMTLELFQGGASKKEGFGLTLENEEGGTGVFPGAMTRAALVTEGGRDYFEGVITSNRAGEFSMDNTHFGFRPDAISWYRAQLLGGGRGDRSFIAGTRYTVERVGNEWTIVDGVDGVEIGPRAPRAEALGARLEKLRESEGVLVEPQNVAILEELQSKRTQRAREYGVTKDPDNAHARLIALQREADLADRRARGIEEELQLDRWEPADDHSRYVPRDDAFESEAGRGTSVEAKTPEERAKLNELDILRTKINELENEIHELEHITDTSPVPWAPHLDTWYEPALKGFLRAAAERLEPDAEGNIRVTWTPGSEQAERYNARRYVEKIEWTQGDTSRDVGRWTNVLEPREGGKPYWDVTFYFKQGQDLRSKSLRITSEKQMRETFGKVAAERILKNDPDYGGLPGGGGTLPTIETKNLPIGGEWAVKLYGDTKERIARLWPDFPELQEYAWRTSGNKAIAPAWLEKYAKAWGGRIELNEQRATEEQLLGTPFGETPQLELTQPTLVIPEPMRQMILKSGQLYFGRKLPDLPKGKGYGVRNTVTPEQAAEAARELVRKRFKKTTNIIGDRIPSPERDEGGFLGFGGPKKPELDPRVTTDVADRGRDTSGPGVFFRSPSKWMAGQKDARVDAIAERIFDAEVREHGYTVEWGRRFTAIIDHLKASTFAAQGRTKERKLLGRKEDQAALKQTFSQFIDLIEKPFEVDGPPIKTKDGMVTPKIPNPDRQSSNPLIQRALEEHDALSKDFKDYLIQSYQDRGIRIADPENWGISDRGYFRHLFPGEDNIFKNGEYQGTGKDYLDAVIKANALIEADPTATVEIKRRPIQFVDPSVRISTRSFERLIRATLGTLHTDGYVTVSARDVRQDYTGLVGKKENIGKFFAAALKREGYEGYERDYEVVMRAHLFQLARSQELSRLRKDITPLLEELQREGKRGVVEGIERHMNDLWGRPLDYEKAVGGFIRRFPALRERIANPDLGLEILARRIASFHNILKLRYNPKAMFVNRIQPLRTLWPYLTTKDMMAVIKKYRDPKWQQLMTELGVMSGAVKLETGGSRIEGFGAKEFLKDPFTYVSGSNRALGYTAGRIFAEREGLNGYDAHRLGMKWAAKVEFDNSKWDAPRFLRHSMGQIFGQYKGFLVKDIENTIDIFSRQPGDTGISSKASRVGKWVAGTAVAGGARAALSPIPWMGTALGYSVYLSTAAVIKALTGASDKDSKFLASIAFLGPPAAAGLDISASVTPIDDPPGITGWEKVGRFVSGPTVTAAYDIGRGTRQLVAPGKGEKRPASERFFNLATKITPYARMVQRAYQLEQDVVHGKPQYMTLDRHRVRLTRTQEFAGTFGVSPASQTLYYEEKEATGKSPLSKGRLKNPFGDPNRGILKPFKPLPIR